MHLRLFDGERVKVQLQWEPRDLWIGLFWRVNVTQVHGPVVNETARFLHLYVCIVPLIPLHVTILSISNHA